MDIDARHEIKLVPYRVEDDPVQPVSEVAFNIQVSQFVLISGWSFRDVPPNTEENSEDSSLSLIPLNVVEQFRQLFVIKSSQLQPFTERTCFTHPEE